MTDWQAIRTQYEEGASLRSLALKHGLGKSTIAERKQKEQWTRTPDTGHRTPDIAPTPAKPTPLPIPADAVSIARIGLAQLARHLQTDALLPISSHKSISDALASYVKVLVTAPQEPEESDGLVIPFDRLSPRTRMEIRRLLAEDEQQHKSQGVS